MSKHALRVDDSPSSRVGAGGWATLLLAVVLLAVPVVLLWLSRSSGPSTPPPSAAAILATAGAAGPAISAHAGAAKVRAPQRVVRARAVLKRLPPRKKPSPGVLLARKVAALSPATSTFTVAQSNILGSQHSAGRGGFAPGTVRAAMTAGLVSSSGVDVGAMQEVQADQLQVLQGRMAGYSFWPAAVLGHNGIRNQIYWRSTEFSLMDTGSVTYTFSGQRIPLPYVLLRDRQSGAEFWMISTHNSAGSLESQRDVGTAVEINLIHTLMATDRPVIIAGDMNEHTEFFCRVAASTGMVAANGGTGLGGCHLPPRPLRVDWIMGGGGMSFSGYRQDATGLGRASDHFYLYATATATSSWYAP
jgi:endonuclease/exonuclease/phosphatase family metal-dependent hydrolase